MRGGSIWSVILVHLVMNAAALNMIAIGDSLTQGRDSGSYPETLLMLMTKREPCTMVNLGMNGDLTDAALKPGKDGGAAYSKPGILPRFREEMARHQANHFQTCLILGGTNDLHHIYNRDGKGFTKEITLSNLVTIANECVQHGAYQSILIGIPPASVFEVGSESDQARLWINQELIKFASRTPSVLYVDIDALLGSPRSSNLWDDDGVHLSQGGYDAIATKLLESIMTPSLWDKRPNGRVMTIACSLTAACTIFGIAYLCRHSNRKFHSK